MTSTIPMLCLSASEHSIPKSENGLQDALKAVSNLLESEYTLAYYLPKTSHKLRKIEVNVDRRDARVLTTHFTVANLDAAEQRRDAQRTLPPVSLRHKDSS